MNIDEIQRKKKCISTFFYLNKLSNIYRTSKTTFETNRNTPKHQLQCMYSYNRAATKLFECLIHVHYVCNNLRNTEAKDLNLFLSESPISVL